MSNMNRSIKILMKEENRHFFSIFTISGNSEVSSQQRNLLVIYPISYLLRFPRSQWFTLYTYRLILVEGCDDIIRQHKAACLRVTSLLACKDLLWIGTSAGVLLTMSLPHINSSTTKLNTVPCVTGVPHGHTGHARFLTNVECHMASNDSAYHRYSYKGKPEVRNNMKLLVISGGDGYEDFRSSNISEVAGREDSTNHLLLWNI